MDEKTNITDDPFEPALFLRNPHVQSIMASSRLRLHYHWRNELARNTEEVILKTSTGSRLVSYLTRHPEPKGMFVFLHGWEGSSSSIYILDSADYFYRRGYMIGRLNLRDHGDSHHLNEDLFHAARLKETFDGVDYLASLSRIKPVCLVGFSRGGNFARRTALPPGVKPINHLERVFASGPPMNPYKATMAIDNGRAFYRYYFLKKWKRSLMKKQKLFPDRYDFSDLMDVESCMELTKMLIPYFPEIQSYQHYFKMYTLKYNAFKYLSLPLTVLIAEDDPIVSYQDFLNMDANHNLKILKQRYGGHCGFLDLFPASCWYQKAIAAIVS